MHFKKYFSVYCARSKPMDFITDEKVSYKIFIYNQYVIYIGSFYNYTY